MDLDPLYPTKLVVMSYPSDSTETRGSGLILASSPAAKKHTASPISVVPEIYLPYPSDLYIVAPRMAYYMEKNREINTIYKNMQMKRTIMSIPLMKASLM